MVKIQKQFVNVSRYVSLLFLYVTSIFSRLAPNGVLK